MITRIIFLSVLVSNGLIAMQSTHQATLLQKKEELKALVNAGNNTLRTIAGTKGIVSADSSQKLLQVTSDITQSVSIIDDLVAKIKATEASHANDAKHTRIFEDIFGDIVDVLEETPQILNEITSITQQVNADQQHPMIKFHAAVAAAKTMVIAKK